MKTFLAKIQSIGFFVFFVFALFVGLGVLSAEAATGDACIGGPFRTEGTCYNIQLDTESCVAPNYGAGSDDCGNFELCCVPPDPDPCTRAGYKCVEKDTCTGEGKTPQSHSCEAGSDQECCEVSGSSGNNGNNGGGGTTVVKFENPLKYDTVEQVLTSILTALQGIIVTISILFIVIGGIIYLTSAGNTKQTEMAKGAVFAALIGLAIGVAAPTFLREIYDILGAREIPENVAEATPIIIIVMNVLRFLLAIFGSLALIMLVIGGLAYLTSGGNSNQAETGMNIIKYAIIGIAVTLGALILVTQVISFFQPAV